MANILPAYGEIPSCIVINRSPPPPVPMFLYVWVQIPADVCPLFGSKRHSFLFVIDKEPSRRNVAFGRSFVCGDALPGDGLPPGRRSGLRIRTRKKRGQTNTGEEPGKSAPPRIFRFATKTGARPGKTATGPGKTATGPGGCGASYQPAGARPPGRRRCVSR